MFKSVNSGRVTDDVITHNNASFLSGRLGHHYVILNKHENKGWTIKRLNVGSGGSKTKTPGTLEQDQATGGRPLILAVTNPYQIFNYQECTRPPTPTLYIPPAT